MKYHEHLVWELETSSASILWSVAVFTFEINYKKKMEIKGYKLGKISSIEK